MNGWMYMEEDFWGMHREENIWVMHKEKDFWVMHSENDFWVMHIEEDFWLHISYHRPSFSPAAAVRQPSSFVDLSPHEFILALLALMTIPMLIYIFIFAFDCPWHCRRQDPSTSEPSIASEASHREIELASVDVGVKYQKKEHSKEIEDECPVAVQTLLRDEKSLYDYVFGSAERKIADSCFALICKDGATTRSAFQKTCLSARKCSRCWTCTTRLVKTNNKLSPSSLPN
ncbi:uncharacterized protein HKW66_Vig0184100 [Vigna angularis]|uniref:Uncharacterized protein n=1 Tax=Phaseolus angularis TaxID=3914 RepID=A0A8T0KTT1_PHAAN|nr:uncharacterized protein HKW66_Vig0184100 [Vigna angularis]